MGTSLLRRFLSILGGRIGTLFLGLLITPVLVRLLGSSAYGDYAFVLSVLGISMILVNAGIFDGTRKYIAEDRDDRDWAAHVFGFYLRVGVLFATIAAFGFVSFSWLGLAERFFESRFVLFFTLLGGLIIGRQAFSIARGGLMGMGLEEWSEPLTILKRVLFGITAVSLAFVGAGVAGVLIGHIFASVVASAIAFGILFQRLNFRSVFGRLPSDLPTRELLSFNGLSVVFILLTASLYHVDILLLNPIAGSEPTGYYRAALVVAEFLWFVPNVLQITLLHSSSELWSEGRTEDITEMISAVTRYNLALVLLFAIGIAGLAGDFVPIYFGQDFEAAILPLLILLPGVVGFAISRPVFAVGQGKGELRILIYATGSAALLNLCLNLVLIPAYGMAGAAVATSLGYGSMVVLHVWTARKLGYDPIADLRLGRILAAGIPTSIAVFGLALIIDSSIVALVVVPPVGFLVYSAAAVKFHVVDRDELQTLESRLPQPIRGIFAATLAKL